MGGAAAAGGDAVPIVANLTHNATTVASTATTASMPSDIPSLLTFLVSFSALRDWLKLIVIGSFFETLRRFFSNTWSWLVNSFYITASFHEDDDSFNWVMLWLSKHPAWTKARDVEISTRSFNLTTSAVVVPGDEDDKGESGSGRRLAYLPSLTSSYSLWYKGRRMTVSRAKNNTGYYGRAEETLQITIMTRNHDILNQLLIEAKKDYKSNEAHNIAIYVSDSSNNWRHVASRPKRPLRSIVLDPGIKELILEDALDFMDSKEWYVERGIPFRRGYLLYGAPGSGKTSIIHSLAGELGLDVYVISLSRVGLDDSSLSELLSELPEKCIAIMEDIDAAFHQTLTREASQDDKPGPSQQGQGQGQNPNSQGQNQAPPPPPSTSRVTLSGLLNAIDGVGAQEGRILFATTNKYHALDPALCRAGRMDRHVEFKLASKYQAAELYKCFYLPTGANRDEVKENVEVEAKDEDGEKDSVDSGYSTVNGDSTPPSETSSTIAPEDDIIATTTATTAHRKPKAPQLSRAQVFALAAQFSNAIPDREFSMASLQGYLMTHKIRPFEAAQEAAHWVETERASREEKCKAAAVLKTPAPSVASPDTPAPS
ncbi:hypothetical protein JAAARDRAFT_123262 [Jaapia argillacea MUCL 33604]|uniref:AAA+ ATPase domain-containing protein n=1 Tax=Jaapia argillacea MUCL 33604 TaxID=933084 RepID=A0A067Q3I0_9AGAM|nr:hypothetical protein JAAARDRAFT_123262 [Jaapia argillacea MUCL 33604]